MNVHRLSLAALPTPLERFDGDADGLWIKRDDLTSAHYGGNKVRKLEYLLGDAKEKGCDTLVTVGAWGSHHCLATAIFGQRSGFDVHLVLAPQPVTEHVTENLRCDLEAGAELHPIRHAAFSPFEMRRLSARLRAQSRRPYLIEHGGSSPVGTLAFVHAARELAKQVKTSGMEVPDIFVALGSGATAAGLALGFALLRHEGQVWPGRIVAVQATPALVANRGLLFILALRTAKLLRAGNAWSLARDALRFLEIDRREFGSGYGATTDRGEHAHRVAKDGGLELDPTYTSKTFASALRTGEGDEHRPRVYWHSLSSVDLRERLARAPEAPIWCR